MDGASCAFERLRGDAPLAVYIDLKSPYAYLAIEPTRAMARSLGVRIDWRPFTLDIPSYLGSAKLDRGGKVASQQRTPQQWSGVKYAYYDARRYANLVDRTVRGTVKIWDSSGAGIAMLWAKREGDAAFDRFLDEIYPRFWRRELDIEDPAVLEAVLADAGIGTRGFADFLAGEGRALHDAQNRDAFDAGVFGVPTLLAADEAWFGREHLPRIAWLLSGREGPPPEAANRSFAREAEPRHSGAGRVTLLLDLRHPLAYLALHPAIALSREPGVEVDLLPLEAPTLNPPSEPAPGDDRGARHRRYRARAIAREALVYGAAQGLVLRELYRSPDPSAAHLGWLFVRERAPDALPGFLAELFRDYWRLELDPADPAQVAARVDAAKADAAGFRAWCEAEGPAAARALAEDLRARGLGTVPAFLVEDEVFHGRQHLPMIRWILGGRRGPGPI